MRFGSSPPCSPPGPARLCTAGTPNWVEDCGCCGEPPHRAPHGFLLGTVSTRGEAAPEHHGGGQLLLAAEASAFGEPVPQEDVQPHDLALAVDVSMLAGKDLRVQAVQPSSGLEKLPHCAGRFAGRWVDAFVRLVSGELHPMVLLRHRSREVNERSGRPQTDAQSLHLCANLTTGCPKSKKKIRQRSVWEMA